ncbi:MAG: TIGR01777 family oxidoreductase [Gemmataceae bacterium]|nr:TIGR01777 family oxidoreductase [Gemmataceae bacterium]
MRVFITGGTGLVGKRLCQKLIERGDRPVVLTRSAEKAKMIGGEAEAVVGDPIIAGPWMDAVAGYDGVVSLAGEGVFARRWSADFKKTLFDSRILTTRNVAQALAAHPKRADGSPKAFVSASAIGWYGPHGDEPLDESSPPGNDFLSGLCVEWEKEARKPEAAGVRCAQVRVGVVLDKEGGALAQMLTPFRLFMGGPVGSGKQAVSWIHHEDMVGIFLQALDDERASGPINGTAPNPVANKRFGQALGRAMGRPSFVWTPGFMLRLFFGEVAGLVTQGQRVLPRAAERLGYVFQFPTIDAALADLFKR